MNRRYFAVGPTLYKDISPEAQVIGTAVQWLIDAQNLDGTWGGPDNLDRFITTTHVVMSLLSIGLTHGSSLLKRAIDYLVTLDTDNNISFFWRSGVLLNIEDYEPTVHHDMEHMWRFRKRVGVHKDYPVPFFLLKLLRFAKPTPALSFQVSDVLQWILDEWDPEHCWYGRTSITSMSLALIHDLDFPNKADIVKRSKEFLQECYRENTDGSGMYHPNLVDDCFTVYNLCEGAFVKLPEAKIIRTQVGGIVKRISQTATASGNWDSGPPFGGNIGSQIYPTAVAIRALLSYGVLFNDSIIVQVSAVLMDYSARRVAQPSTSITPFWGSIPERPDISTCFVLMPFERRLTEIYERYIKAPIIARTTLQCLRADDIFAPRPIMNDVWREIGRATVIIADLTTRNPNVLYELGLAHALGKHTILVSQNLKDVPFDLRSIRVIVYEDTLTGYDNLTRTVIKYLEELGVVVS